MHSRQAYTVLFFATLLVGGTVPGADLFPEETAFRITYDATPVALSGRVVAPSGASLEGCSVSLASGMSVLSGVDGTFTLGGLSRSNQLLILFSGETLLVLRTNTPGSNAVFYRAAEK